MINIEQAINSLDLSIGVVNSSDLSQFPEEIYEDLIWYLIENDIDIIYDKDNESQLYVTDIDEQHNIDLDQVPCLRKSDQYKLLCQYSKNNQQEVRQQLIETKLPTVMKIAPRYYSGDYPTQDTNQNGYLGLVKAVANFNDPDIKNFRKHIDHWIRQTIEREKINSKSTIRIPIGQDLKLTEFKKALEALTDDLGNQPTVNDLAIYLDITSEEVEKLFANYIIQKVASLDELIENEETATLVDTTMVNPEVNIYENSYQEDIKEFITQLLDTLPEREKRVIEYRYGFIGNKIYTLEELIKEFHVTTERISKIELTAVKRLRYSSSIKKILDYK